MLQRTKFLNRLSWAESSKHTEDLMECLCNSAYTSPLVFDMDPYVDVPAANFPIIFEFPQTILDP
jgi:hypothetical protein